MSFLKIGGRGAPSTSSSPRPVNSADDLRNAAKHLLEELYRASQAAESEPEFLRDVRRLASQLARATSDAELEDLALRAQELRFPAMKEAKKEGDGVEAQVVDATVPVAKSIGIAGMVQGVARLLEQVRNGLPRPRFVKSFREEMEHLAHGVLFLRQTAEVLRNSVGELADVLGPLAADEPAAPLRLRSVRDQITRAANLHELEQLREQLLQEATVLVEEANSRSERATEAQSLMRIHAAHAKVLELALADATTMAQTDPLTGLANRHGLERFVERQASSKADVGIIALDVDHFKKVNDTYGHDVGDVVLRHIAQTVSGELRGGDHAFRVGGEEFLVVLADTDAQGAKATAERLRVRVERQLIRSGEHSLKVTISLGVAVWGSGQGFQSTVKAADQALYAAKRAGRNRVAMRGK